MFFNTVVLRGQCGVYKMQDAKPENLNKKKLRFFQYKLAPELSCNPIVTSREKYI